MTDSEHATVDARSADERLDEMLSALDRHRPGAPFVPPVSDLSAIHAGREHLALRPERTTARWYDHETDGLALIEANLTGMVLARAVLIGANLRGADLSHVAGLGADLSHATLEGAHFVGSDFCGAHFASVDGGEADFSGALLEDARFEHARLRFAQLSNASIDGADFTHADLWGATLDSVDADEASFRGARLDEASLQNGNFAGADFSDASLKKAKLSGAKLKAANLTGAHVEGADLNGADLSYASLPRLNLLSCDLRHLKLAGAWLEATRLLAHQLGGAVGEEIEGDFEGARDAYVALEQNFRSLGNVDDASWAFRRRRVMGKRHAAAMVKTALRAKEWRQAFRPAVRWGNDRFVEWLCDYGESLSRVLRAYLTVIVVFATAYGCLGAVLRGAHGPHPVPTRNPLDLAAFSFLNMITTSPPDIGLQGASETVVILSSVQGVLGTVLLGLFGYVLGNRLHR